MISVLEMFLIISAIYNLKQTDEGLKELQYMVELNTQENNQRCDECDEVEILLPPWCYVPIITAVA